MNRLLENRKRFNLVLNFGTDLHTTSTVTDNRYLLAFEICCFRPTCRMPLLPFPIFDTFNIGGNRRIKNSGSTNHNIGFSYLLTTVWQAKRYKPILLVLLVFDFFNCGFEANGVPYLKTVTNLF